MLTNFTRYQLQVTLLIFSDQLGTGHLTFYYHCFKKSFFITLSQTLSYLISSVIRVISFKLYAELVVNRTINLL